MLTSLEQAVAYIKAGEIEKAKQLLAEVLKQNPRDENAWLWMTRCVTDTEQKRYCFDKVLKINPNNENAKRGLAQLQQKQASQQPTSIPAQRLETKQQSLPQRKPKKSNPLITILAVIGLLSLICVCGVFYLWFFAPSTTGSGISAHPTDAEPEYLLELIAMNDTREYDFITVEGQVKNISGVSLDSIVAVVEFYDSNGDFVKSDSALIDYDPILSGQTSPFSVITTDNPAIKKYSTTFKYFAGGTLPTKDSR